MNKDFKKKLITTTTVFITCLALLLLAIWTISALKYKYNITTNNSFTIIFDKNKVKRETVEKYEKARNLLRQNYYENIDENSLLEGSIAGMTESLNDPYTVYFSKDQMKIFTEKTEGSYVGIGISVTLDNNGVLTIVEPFDSSPAKESGIIQGDKILKVDDKDVTTIRDEDIIIKMIKGTNAKENSKVKLTIYRPSENKTIDIVVTRKRIKVTNIKSEVLDNNIGYIKISTFDEEIAKYFNNHLDSLLSKNIKGLIIDVRDNPGGDYNQVVKIADRILPKGIIVYTQDKNGEKKIENSDDNKIDIPIAVLVNNNSASASEVLAGAIKDNNKGILVGTKTFGKGLVQMVYQFDDGSGIKITVARYYTPSGVCIQGKGIEPDQQIELDAKYKTVPVSQIPHSEDSQLNKALQFLSDNN